MKKLPIYFIIVVLFYSCAARTPNSSQSKSDDEKYVLAKELLAQNAYSEAFKLFQGLYQGSAEKSDFITSSKYYAAYCQYKLENYKDANFILYQLITIHPEWKKIDLAYYLKAVVQLETHNYIDAFIQFAKVKSEPYLSKSNAAKGFYLQTKISADTVEILKKRFPTDKFLTSFQNKPTIISEVLTFSGKDLNIAVLMPFEASANNHFVYEMYEGMLMGADSLKKNGLTINLLPYETGKDSAKVIEFTNLQNAANFDAIIGPVYNNQQATIAQFAKDKKAIVINPLSQFSTFSKSIPGYYLNKPSFETQGKQAAEYAFQNFNRTKNAVIIYGLDGGDSLMAKAYKIKYEQMGGKVLVFRRLSKFTANLLPTVMSKTKMDSVSHFTIFTSEPTLGANVFTYLETTLLEKTATYKVVNEEGKEEEKKEEIKTKVTDIPVIVTSKWLDFQAINLEQLVLHQTHFVFSENINPSDTIYKNIETLYFDKTGLNPTPYVYYGYNLMLYWGSLLGKYDKKIAQYIKQTAPIRFDDFYYKNYTTGNDNGFVPLFKLENNILQIVNAPLKNE